MNRHADVTFKLQHITSICLSTQSLHVFQQFEQSKELEVFVKNEKVDTTILYDAQVTKWRFIVSVM